MNDLVLWHTIHRNTVLRNTIFSNIILRNTVFSVESQMPVKDRVEENGIEGAVSDPVKLGFIVPIRGNLFQHICICNEQKGVYYHVPIFFVCYFTMVDLLHSSS
jgi:hypothetical protein